MPSASRRAVSSLATTARGSLASTMASSRRTRRDRSAAAPGSNSISSLSRMRWLRPQECPLHRLRPRAGCASTPPFPTAPPRPGMAIAPRGCVASRLAPRPLARRNWPGAPRALPMRSGKASASRRAIDMSSTRRVAPNDLRLPSEPSRPPAFACRWRGAHGRGGNLPADGRDRHRCRRGRAPRSRRRSRQPPRRGRTRRRQSPCGQAGAATAATAAA